MLCCTNDNFFVTNVFRDLLSIYDFFFLLTFFFSFYCLHDHQPCIRVAIAPLAFMSMRGKDKK